MPLAINPRLLKTTTLGFILGSSIPILFTNLYLIPSKNFQTEKELSTLKKWLNLMSFQVWNLEQRSQPQTPIEATTSRAFTAGGSQVFNQETGTAYRDALYWAGF